MTDAPHRRYNPLKDEWILVCPQRAKRPWKGQIEEIPDEVIPRHDPSNQLCPGAVRSSGQVNPQYESTFVFPNDFPALIEQIGSLQTSVDASPAKTHPLLRAEPAYGECKVMCYHPWTDLRLSTMTHQQIRSVVDKWAELHQQLGNKHTWVQIFSNEGKMMGCSNPHPHCQVWATSFLPNEPAIKDKMQQKYLHEHKSNLLLDYVQLELEAKERIVVDNAHWLCVVPYWAVWPYETMLLPKHHVLRLEDLDEAQRSDLVDIMKRLLVKYDNLFKTPFPYSMGWHGAPTGDMKDKDNSHWQLHALYYPPLLRSATVKKFMVGYEMLANQQRDLTAEQAAETLRKQSDAHYKSS